MPNRCDLALGDSEFNRQDLEALGFRRTGVLPVVPDFSHLDGGAGPHGRRSVRRHLDQRPVRRPDGAEQEARRRHPVLSRVSHVLQPAIAAAPGRRAWRARALHRGAAPAHGHAGQRPCPLRRTGLERRAGGVLRDRRSLPVRERARGLLRAARRGVLQADSGAGLRRHRGAGDDGWRRSAVLRQGSVARRGADGHRRVERSTCRKR